MNEKKSIKELAELYPEIYDKENPSIKEMHELGQNITMIKWSNFKLKLKNKLRMVKK